MILIIGSEEEYHSKYIYDKLVSKKVDVCYFDSRKYPDEINLCYTPDAKEGYFTIEGKKIPINEIQGIYWRWFYGVPYLKTSDNFVASIVHRERVSCLNSFFMSFECNWLNSYRAIELHKTKVHQLKLMLKNNIRIPKTIVTNDKEALIDFYNKNNKNVIYKPVLGGAMTKRLTDEDLKEENLQTLKTSPVQLQEFIKGVDIRVYTMGNEIFPAEIRAKTIDFRADNNSEIVPVEIPMRVKNDCKKILKILDLNYSGIDIRKTYDGEYVFIEANPAPMFIHFENVTKYPIADSLVKLLTKD